MEEKGKVSGAYLAVLFAHEALVLVEKSGVLLSELLVGQVDGEVMHEELHRLPLERRHPVQSLEVVGRRGVEETRQEGVDLAEVGALWSRTPALVLRHGHGMLEEVLSLLDRFGALAKGSSGWSGCHGLTVGHESVGRHPGSECSWVVDARSLSTRNVGPCGNHCFEWK